MSDKYNGWTNYETWNAALWMDNDEFAYNSVREMAQGCYDTAAANNVLTREEVATQELAETLKQGHEDAMPEVSGVYADLLNAASSEINWDEIAAHLIAEVDKAEAE